VNYNKAVNGVDFFIKKGESVGLVGESGSGKTTLGRCIVRLYEPTEGSIEFNINGQMIDLTKVSKKEMKSIRKHAVSGCVFIAGFKNESCGYRD